MGMERRGTVAPCMSGRSEDVGGLSPPTDAVYGLIAGLYVPARASHDGACIRLYGHHRSPPAAASR
eukprot:997620-Prymnesium_polylepis.1